MGTAASKDDDDQEDDEFARELMGKQDGSKSLNPLVAAQYLVVKPMKDMVSIVSKARVPNTKGFKKGAHRLKVVFAKPLTGALGNLEDIISFRPKSAEVKSFIESALSKFYLCENMKHSQLLQLVQAMEESKVKSGESFIQQGDKGDYFYLLYDGTVDFFVDEKLVGSAEKGDLFGELALLYDAPRAATVKAATDVVLYRVNQRTFRLIMKEQSRESESSKVEALKKVDFLKDLLPQDLQRLAAVMRPRKFLKGERLIEKGQEMTHLWIIIDGQVNITDIGEKNIKYEDAVLNGGATLGAIALLRKDEAYMNATANTDGFAFVIDKVTFETVLGKLEDLLTKSMDQRKLGMIKIFQASRLDPPTLNSLARLITERKFRKGDIICKEGALADAALYLIKTGKVEKTATLSVRDRTEREQKTEVIGADGYFGEDQLLADAKEERYGLYSPTTTKMAYTAIALEDCVIGVLSLACCRRCVDTQVLGKPDGCVVDSFITKRMKIDDLSKHSILGAGTFGQVWLVSRTASTGEVKAYALKIQSKYELVESGQANAVVCEKNIMSQLHSPFLISLISSAKDQCFVYLVMELVQGGELYSIMRCDDRTHLPERHAQFYCAGVFEGLAYMHRRNFVYRDLKPENVLIKNDGYPVIVDFGFAKYVPEKTYTLCGTPLYLAPEVLTNVGHNHSADIWSLGVMLFEMLTGHTPFYRSGMDQSALFKAIIRGKFHMPKKLSENAASLIKGLLVREPCFRLGCLAGGPNDIYEHPFFAFTNWGKYRKKEVKAPYVPKVKNLLDHTNFEDWSHLEDKTKVKHPILTPEHEAIFQTF